MKCIIKCSAISLIEINYYYSLLKKKQKIPGKTLFKQSGIINNFEWNAAKCRRGNLFSLILILSIISHIALHFMHRVWKIESKPVSWFQITFNAMRVYLLKCKYCSGAHRWKFFSTKWKAIFYKCEQARNNSKPVLHFCQHKILQLIKSGSSIREQTYFFSQIVYNCICDFIYCLQV